MATPLTVYPNARYVSGVLTSLTVYAADEVTLIPQDGAIVDYELQYYKNLLASGELVTASPFLPLGPAVNLVIPTPVVVGGPGDPGDVLTLVTADTAEFDPPTGGGSTTGMLTSEFATIPLTADDEGLVRFAVGTDGGLFVSNYPDSATADNALVYADQTGTGRFTRWLPDASSRKPEWYGVGRAGNTDAQNRDALAAAIAACSGGVVLHCPRTQSPVDIGEMVHVAAVGQSMDGLVIDGGWYRSTADADAVTDPGAVLSLRQSSTHVLEHIAVRNLRITGNSQYTDRHKGLQMGFTWFSRFENLLIEDQSIEGLYFPGPANCRHNWVTNCLIRNMGKSQTGPSPLSAYNVNTSWLTMRGAQAYNVGRFIEHTGENAIIDGFIFKKSSYGGVGCMLQSTTYHNRGMVFANGIIIDSPYAVGISDNARSHGLVYMANLIINEARTCFQHGSKPGSNQPCVLDGALIIDGGDRTGHTDDAGRAGTFANAVYEINTGGHVAQNVVVARPESVTTGEIQSGNLSRMFVPTSTTLMHTLTIGSTFEIAGDAGTKTVTGTSATSTWEHAPHDRIDFTPAAAGAIAAGAAVTYRPSRHLYLARVQNVAANDYFTIQRWTILDVPWSSHAFGALRGYRYTIKDFTMQPRGQSYGSIGFLQVVDVGGGSNAGNLLSCAQFDATKPWCFSATEPSFFYGTSVPNTMTWKRGDTLIYSNPTAGGVRGQVCTTEGSNGTLVGITATTAIGSPNVTLAGGSYLGQGVCVDSWITIAGEFGGAKVRVLSGLGANIVVSANATVGVAGAAVAYATSVWKDDGAIAA